MTQKEFLFPHDPSTLLENFSDKDISGYPSVRVTFYNWDTRSALEKTQINTIMLANGYIESQEV